MNYLLYSNFITEAIETFFKSVMVQGIIDNLTGTFESTNETIGDAADLLSKTPQQWNSTVFSMVHSLSENVLLPVAGLILAFVMTLELIQMVTDRNNMHDVDSWMFFKWIFKTACAIMIVSHTWDIVMGIFEASQWVVNKSASIVSAGFDTGGTTGSIHTVWGGIDTYVDVTEVFTDLEDVLLDMEIGELLGTWVQTLLIKMCNLVFGIIIFIIVWGRIIEIYLVTSMAPLPIASILSRNGGGMGQNYIRNIFALAFQTFLMMVCIAIYAALVQHVPEATSADEISKYLWTCMGYTVLLSFALFKTGSLAKSVFASH